MAKTVTYTEQVELTLVTCYACAVIFGMPTKLNQTCHRHGNTFYCPNGHGQVYGTTIESELAETKRQLEIERNQKVVANNQLNTAMGQLSKTSKKLASVKKRISNGVCPCCHRQFVNVQRHMAGMHPEFVSGE